MMKIELLYFAQVRDALGTDRESLEVESGCTVSALVRMIERRAEWRRIERLPLSFAVNEEMVDGGRVLSDGDRVALLPPVSGG